MKFNYLFILITSLLLIKISTFENEVQNGVYIIQNLEGNLNLKIINSTLYCASKDNKNNIDKFHFYRREFKKENEYDSYNDEESGIYYYIEEKDSKKKLYFDESTETILASETINPEDDDKFLWEIKAMNYKNNLHYYEIKSKTKNKYISYEESKKDLSKIYCESSWTSLAKDRKTKFKIIKLYTEHTNIYNQLNLENEPIDVVIKYIDLNDESLAREDFDQIEKDKQNNELKYSLRSILKNIPWVRKIFIIMPNEQISFLKEQSEIKDKIIYINDKDLLGFDSSAPPVFQFNLHKLKKYGLSENFILMDDDYFIGQPLSKSDFFYEENEKIYPLLISTEYSEIDEDDIKSQYVNYLSKIDDIEYHSDEGFLFRKISTLLFLYKIFETKKDTEPLIEVGYTHNAIPLKISDIEEINTLIKDKYTYSEICLKGKKRNIRSLQPQILFMNYAKNKYDRHVKELSWKYYDLSDVRKVNLDSKLFVINVEDKEYYPTRFKTEEEVLNDLFPNPTKYEKEYINKDEDINKDLNKEKEKNEPKIENINDLKEIFNRIQDINKNKDDKSKDKKEEQNINDLKEIFSRIQNIYKNNENKTDEINEKEKEEQKKEKK